MASADGASVVSVGDLSAAAGSADAPWWVAHTRARHEKSLADELGQIGVFCYLPLCQRVTRSRATRRVSRSIVPVFPGYVFFVADEEQRYRALRTNHIARTLPVTNRAALIAQLRQVDLALRSGEPITRSGKLAEGERVRVVAGALMGLEGVVTRWKSRVRIVLNVEILGQSAVVEVDADLVERMEA